MCIRDRYGIEQADLVLFFQQKIDYVLDNDDNIIEGLVSMELEIIEDISIMEEDKFKLLYHISIIKNGFVAFALAAPNWEDLWNDCMRRKLRDIFSNPVSAARFMLTGPGELLGLGAECAWEVATANSTE